MIKYLKESGAPSHGKFIIEPCGKNMVGVLGNAMRRILLSSLPWTAATSIRIKNVQHERTTIPGVKGDVPEIVLNVKSIIFKPYSENARTVRIEAEGKYRVTAGDMAAWRL